MCGGFSGGVAFAELVADCRHSFRQWQQCRERLERCQSYVGLQSPTLSDMPKASGSPGDRMLEYMVRTEAAADEVSRARDGYTASMYALDRALGDRINSAAKRAFIAREVKAETWPAVALAAACHERHARRLVQEVWAQFGETQ